MFLAVELRRLCSPLWWDRVSVLAYFKGMLALLIRTRVVTFCRAALCDQTFSYATKPWVWFSLFDPLLPPSSIPCIFMFTIPPSLPVGQSEERSDGSSSGSGAGAGPGESSVSLASDKVSHFRHTECLLFFFINKYCL